MRYGLAFTVMAFGLCVVSGCNGPTSTSQGEGESKTIEAKDLVTYKDMSVRDFERDFQSRCPNNGGYLVCIAKAAVAFSPMRFIDGAAVCIPPDNEYEIVLSAWFAYEGGLAGYACRIDKKSYDSIESHYGYSNILRSYPGHRDLDGFETWKTGLGYVTLYREIRAIPSQTGDQYDYFLYVGRFENPEYSH